MSNYITISSQNFTWEQEIKKSRFILNISRIHSESEAKQFIAAITKQHYKATHNVFAYVLGENDAIQRFSDNGEPSGTAGVPMLEVLQKNHIHDVVAVVTRYFGGTKLGAGGLIRAYAGTVANGVKAVGLVTRVTRIQLKITINYKYAEIVSHWLETHDYPIINTSYDTDVHIITPVKQAELDDLQQNIADLSSGQALFALGDDTFFEIPLK